MTDSQCDASRSSQRSANRRETRFQKMPHLNHLRWRPIKPDKVSASRHLGGDVARCHGFQNRNIGDDNRCVRHWTLRMGGNAITSRFRLKCRPEHRPQQHHGEGRFGGCCAIHPARPTVHDGSGSVKRREVASPDRLFRSEKPGSHRCGNPALHIQRLWVDEVEHTALEQNAVGVMEAACRGRQRDSHHETKRPDDRRWKQPAKPSHRQPCGEYQIGEV